MGGAGHVVSEGDVSRMEQYKGGVTMSVVLIAIVASSGGLLFGFDNGIMGGVTAMPDYQALFFPAVLSQPAGSNQFCKYNDHVLSLVSACLFLSAAICALLAGPGNKRYGRKAVMVTAGAFFGLGTILVATSFTIGQLIVGRLMLGVGVGFASATTPLFISEMAPYKSRGALNLMFQLAVTIGIFAAQAINLGCVNIPHVGWRIALALGGIPSALMFFGCMLLPDTPNSLVARGRADEGLAVLRRIRGVEDVEIEFADIVEHVEASKLEKSNPYVTILKKHHRPQLTICFFLPLFQQFTGINAIMFFSPQLFEAAGQGGQEALLSTVIIGSVNVAATIIAIAVVDRFGRRFLFFQGGAQMVLSLAIVAALLNFNTAQDNTNENMGASIIAFMCIYVAGFAWSWGPLAWLLPSEVATHETRAAGMSIATCSNFCFTFLIGQCFLSMLCAMEFGVYLFFLALVLVMTTFVYLLVPETKGVALENMDVVLFSNHWFWKHFYEGLPSTDDGSNQHVPSVSAQKIIGDSMVAAQ